MKRVHKQRILRRGAAMVEAALVLPLSLLLLLGALDLSLFLMRQTALTACARHIARAATTHGARAPAGHGQWGPSPITLQANSTHAAAQVTQGMLMSLNPADVAINISWLDGNNEPESRVRVRLSCAHSALVQFPGWYTNCVIDGASTMTIAH